MEGKACGEQKIIKNAINLLQLAGPLLKLG